MAWGDSMALKQTVNTIFEKCKEHFCNKPIPQDFFPSKIVSQLIIEAEHAKVTTINGILVPNQYTFAVTQEEYHMIADIVSPLQARIVVCLAEELERLRYHTQGTLSFQFVVREEEDRAVSVMPLQLDANEKQTVESPTEEEMDDCNSTRVFDKVSTMQAKPAEKQAVICVVDGVDIGKRFVFTDNRVNIGRRENNDLVLTDGSVSRLHAYIIKEAGNHILHDARSLNGTYLNEVQIIKQVLYAGDTIKIGNTVIEYELM